MSMTSKYYTSSFQEETELQGLLQILLNKYKYENKELNERQILKKISTRYTFDSISLKSMEAQSQL